MKKVIINDINMKNKLFWHTYFVLSYPNGYDEELDLSVEEIIGEMADIDWWNDFVDYTDEIFDESDGYLEEPTYLEVELDIGKQLKVEFHPGDILYYINDELVGSTGPHWKLQVISYDILEPMLQRENRKPLFWLLLPLAKVSIDDMTKVLPMIEKALEDIFDVDMCGKISKCLVNQLIDE